MYFAQNVNEYLSNAMRSVAEARIEIGLFIKEEKSKSAIIAEIEAADTLYDSLYDVVSQIATLCGAVLTEDIINETSKEIERRSEIQINTSK